MSKGLYAKVRTSRRDNIEAGASLLKRRRWYADDGGGSEDETPPETGNEPDGSNGNNDELAKLRAEKEEWLKERGTLRNEARKKSDAIKAADEAKKAADEAALMAKGEHETVIANLRAENETLKSRAEIGDKAIETLKVSNQTMIDALPDIWKDAVPEGLGAEALNVWLTKVTPKMKMPQAPDFDAGAGQLSGGTRKPNNGVKLTQEQMEAALKLGMTNDQYAANLPTGSVKRKEE